MSIVCMCVIVKIQFDNTSTIVSTQHTCPPLGRYAPRTLGAPPLLKNSGSSPE